MAVQVVRARRSWAVATVVALVAATALYTAGIGNAATGFGFTRFAGSDRYDTAAKVAIDTFGTSQTVVVTSGENFPDALTAQPFARYFLNTMIIAAVVVSTRRPVAIAEDDVVHAAIAPSPVTGPGEAVEETVQEELQSEPKRSSSNSAS